MRAVAKKSLTGVLNSRPLSILRQRYKGVCSILMYHRVAEVSHELPNSILGVAPEQFEAQMRHIASNCNPLSLRAAIDGLVNGCLPANAVAVTFDDGFKDNLTAALPILEKYKIPATIFISTKFIDGTLAPWWDKEAPMLSWDDVLKLSSDALITIGAHTVSHPVLSSLTETQAATELRESKKIIEQKIGRSVDFLAYPYGTLKQANGREFEIARGIGFQAALTTNPGPLYKRHANDLFALPRFTVDGRDGMQEFVQQLSGTKALMKALLQPLVKDAESKASKISA